MCVILPDPLGHISEFSTGLNGDCVQTAMAVCVANVREISLTPQLILDIVEEMQGDGIAETNGATSINNCGAWMQKHGYAIVAQVDYDEPFHGDWLELLRTHAGINPIVLNLSHAHVLCDEETGCKDEDGLLYHGIAVVGKQDNGYICVDGDNPEANERFQIYSADTLAAAQPCGMTIIQGRSRGDEMTLPNNTTDDGQALHYEGTSCITVRGFRQALLGQIENLRLPYMGIPRTDEIQVDDVRLNGTHVPGVVQFYTYGVLCWERDSGLIYALQSGDILLALCKNHESVNTLQSAYSSHW